jgi:DivIVA domain-containing protein
MDTARPDRAPYGELPPDGVNRDDIAALRFSLAFRGYRMDEVDAVLDRLGGELELRDRRIAELEGHGGHDAQTGQQTDAPREI